MDVQQIVENATRDGLDKRLIGMRVCTHWTYGIALSIERPEGYGDVLSELLATHNHPESVDQKDRNHLGENLIKVIHNCTKYNVGPIVQVI